MDSKEIRILQEQVRLIYKQLPAVVFVPGIGAVLLGAIHWDYVPQHNIITWVSIILVCSSLTPLIVYILYRRYQHSGISPHVWANLINVFGFISGCAWGLSAYYIFSSDNVTLQLILTLYLYSAAALIALMMTAYSTPVYTITSPMLLALAFRFLIDDNIMQNMLGITTIIYLVSLYAFYYPVNQGFLDSIRLWFEKNDLAKELEIRTIEAEKENKAKSRFLAAASHDLRQPLVSQDLLLDALKMNISDGSQLNTINKLKTNTQTLHTLFNQLVEVSKLDTGYITPQQTIVELDSVISRVLHQFIPLAEDKNIRLIADKNKALVFSDKLLLERILKNLVSNAIKFTNKGKVTISQSIDSNKVIINIEDTGIGISKKEQELIYDEFYRSEQSHKSSDGFGLGLSIVKRLCNLLNYELKMISEEYTGTRFSISIPLYQPIPKPARA